MAEQLPKLGSIWRHVKSGAEYEIISFCLIEATLKPAIIYRGGHGFYLDGKTWTIGCRPAEEFMDGRFVFVGF